MTSRDKPVNERTYQEVEYLKKNLGPILVAALAEICIRRPADPIEYLGHWLLRWRYNEELKRRDVQNALEVVRQKQWAQAQQEVALSHEPPKPTDELVPVPSHTKSNMVKQLIIGHLEGAMIDDDQLLAAESQIKHLENGEIVEHEFGAIDDLVPEPAQEILDAEFNPLETEQIAGELSQPEPGQELPPSLSKQLSKQMSPTGSRKGSQGLQEGSAPAEGENMAPGASGQNVGEHNGLQDERKLSGASQHQDQEVRKGSTGEADRKLSTGSQPRSSGAGVAEPRKSSLGEKPPASNASIRSQRRTSNNSNAGEQRKASQGEQVHPASTTEEGVSPPPAE